MPVGIRYTPEERAELKKKIEALQKQKKTQKEMCEALGIATGTLNRMLKDTPHEARRPRASSSIQIPMDSPYVQLALKEKEITDLNETIQGLTERKAKLQEEHDALWASLAEKHAKKAKK